MNINELDVLAGWTVSPIHGVFTPECSPHKTANRPEDYYNTMDQNASNRYEFERRLYTKSNMIIGMLTVRLPSTQTITMTLRWRRHSERAAAAQRAPRPDWSSRTCVTSRPRCRRSPSCPRVAGSRGGAPALDRKQTQVHDDMTGYVYQSSIHLQ